VIRKENYESFISHSIEDMLARREERDWFTFISVGFVYVGTGVIAIVFGIRGGGWWWIATAWGIGLLLTAPMAMSETSLFAGLRGRAADTADSAEGAHTSSVVVGELAGLSAVKWPRPHWSLLVERHVPPGAPPHAAPSLSLRPLAGWSTTPARPAAWRICWI
jgi:hypothetical protein